MTYSKKFHLYVALISSLLLTACTVSFNNDLVKSHSDEIEAYSAQVLEDFYARRTDQILKRAAEGYGFNADSVESTYEFISESAKPEFAVAADRNFRQQNSLKLSETVFHIPRDKGRETVSITVSREGEICCLTYGLRLNVQIGPEFVMETEKPVTRED
jgi:Tfp pilus assembly protein PilE